MGVWSLTWDSTPAHVGNDTGFFFKISQRAKDDYYLPLRRAKYARYSRVAQSGFHSRTKPCGRNDWDEHGVGKTYSGAHALMVKK